MCGSSTLQGIGVLYWTYYIQLADYERKGLKLKLEVYITSP